MSALRRNSGFSLIELMVALGVFAILTALAVPSLSDFMKRNMVTNQTNDMLGAIRFARSTAVTRGTMVSMCASATSVNANPTCSGTNTFDTGWLIYTTKTAGTQYASTDELLRVAQNVPGASIQGTTKVQIVTFDGRGSSTYGVVSFFICSKPASDAVGQSGLRYAGRRIDLQSGGRAGVTTLPTSSSKATAQTNCTAT